ncbi:Ferric-anguibactin receptor FatA [Paraglaciecola mesophila]|uniref:Ferric-anguibactin receptor FatA n=1 Tax=Paraglaciecola mesophila TaxID=197222 RepID=A0A857JMF9_9ALTE|nr:TonB-dependent receptor [Paraglaciecola mesophila]QHJ13259.1 Ferric-anguibactin receptor FatA [Paraglaciecola mesophila]
MKKTAKTHLALCVAMAIGSQSFISFANAQEAPNDAAIEEITVVGKSVSYANNQTSDEMVKQQSSLTSALAVIDNLPGVLINEGDTFGSDDWSTTVSIRGFQLSLDEQQIGITIDGIANGNSNYGGGAKANRYIDTENLAKVEVSQGTGDIASRSNEALGGTLNFTTVDPGVEESMLISISGGSFDAQKYFLRYETGEIAPDTYAWVSVSSSENTDWITQTAENEHDHLAGKFISMINNVEIEGYFSWDDVHEANYQRISLDQFEQNPDSDRLNGQWTGIPYVDQVHRQGWATLRENLFAYLKADYATDNFEVSGNVYYHDNEGRGDWVPPYVVDVRADGDGVAHSELVSGNTVYGGSALGQLYYVDSSGFALSPTDGCTSSITAPYGGAGPEYDPTCYAQGAVPVGSYRHTHYQKERFGFDADFAWYTQINDMDNTLRGGIWYEDYNREESRDWHKIIDSRSGVEFDHTPYWVQYSREFPVETMMLYAEDELDMGWASVRLGVKRFYVDLERQDNFDENNTAEMNSDSDTLFSGGIVVQMPIDGLEAFAGYAENFAAIKDTVLERDASTLTQVEPETAENVDLGLRYVSADFNASLTYYNIKFDNRLTFIAPDSPDGIDFLIGTNGSYVNVGGIESSGFEASLSFNVTDSLALYGSFTYNDSEYTDGSIDFPEGNTVFGSPENMAVVSADWTRGNYFIGASTKWVDDRFIDAANTQVAEAYLVTDFYAGVSLDAPVQGIESIDLRFTVNNMFDESYLGGIAGQSAWIGAPRTAAFNAQARF